MKEFKTFYQSRNMCWPTIFFIQVRSMNNVNAALISYNTTWSALYSDYSHYQMCIH